MMWAWTSMRIATSSTAARKTRVGYGVAMRILRRGLVDLGRLGRRGAASAGKAVRQNLVEALPECLLQILELAGDRLPEVHLLQQAFGQRFHEILPNGL